MMRTCSISRLLLLRLRQDFRLIVRATFDGKLHRPLVAAALAAAVRLVLQSVVLVGALDHPRDLRDEAALAPIVHMLLEGPVLEGAEGLDELAPLLDLLLEDAL